MEETLQRVWLNTHMIKNALEQYEAIGEHASELNNIHGQFWGLTQRFSMDSAVMGICKLYDETNKKYPKHTTPALLNFLIENLNTSHIRMIKQQHLIKLDIQEHNANVCISSLEIPAQFETSKAKLIELIKKVLPDGKHDVSLKGLFTFRNKSLAHQEKLDEVLKEKFKFLPSLEELERLNNWAANFCEFMAYVFEKPLAIPSVSSARMATKNIIKDVLNISFEDPTKSEIEKHEAMMNFYKRRS